MGRMVALIAALVSAEGCMLLPDATTVSIKAYRCAEPGQDQCNVVGDEIPEGALPPMNEAFIVVAKYKGGASRWSLMYPSKYSPGDLDSAVVQINASDSASVWINLMGAKDGLYIERVTSTESVADSIVWEFGWRRPVAATPRLDGTAAQVGLP